MGPSAVSASQATAGAHVRCPPCPVHHLSALMGAHVDRPAIIPMSVLAYQVLKDTTVRTMWMTAQVTSA